MSKAIIRVYENRPLPDHAVVEKVLLTEEMPVGTGTATARVLTVLITDMRYWLTDEDKAEKPIRGHVA